MKQHTHLGNRHDIRYRHDRYDTRYIRYTSELKIQVIRDGDNSNIIDMLSSNHNIITNVKLKHHNYH